MKQFILLQLLFLFSCAAFTQVSVPGEPVSALQYIPANRSSMIIADRPPVEDLMREDAMFPSPYRYGILIPVDADPGTSGQWDHVQDGDVWRCVISAPGALGMALYFDRFRLPEGGQLFIYDINRIRTLGAFTSLNNNPEEVFATELLPGDKLVVEYFHPLESPERPLLHLNEISYAYRGVSFTPRGFGGSGPCEVNINCPEAWQWNEQARGVALIGIRKGSASYWCTGSLINNVRNDRTPYFLTADHCGEGATPDNLLQWVFYFHYESPGCADPNEPPIPKSLTGAVLVAHGGNSATTGSDFFLVRLTEQIPVNYDVYFIGWDRQIPETNTGVTIHHPQGDIKKISFYTTPLRSSTYGSNPNQCFWRVRWSPTESGHGVTEGGSSGSPLFNADRLLVGSLTGGTSSCDSLHLTDYDYYGKFSYHWESNGTDSSARLRDWLDPDNTNAPFLAGMPLGVEDQNQQELFSVYPNPCKDQINLIHYGNDHAEYTATLISSLGKYVTSRKFNFSPSGNAGIMLPELPSGIYLLKIRSEKSSFVTKIIIL